MTSRRRSHDSVSPAALALLLLSSVASHAPATRAADEPPAGRIAPGTPADADIAAALAAVRADEARRVAVFARTARAVVAIFTDTRGAGGGSGVVIDPRGYGLTSFHVVRACVESRRGYGGLADGRLYPLTILGIDPGGDIALFRLEGKESFDCAPLGDSDTLRVGQWVAALGNPFMLAEDYTPTITLGIVSGLHRYQHGQGNALEYADCIQVSTSINPGNSGGPLVDLDGCVVGINGRASFEERGRVNVGLGYAVSINQIKRFLPGLRAGRMLEHGTLGATVRDMPDGLVVSAIQEFSAAERAGVQLGDLVAAVAGRRVRTANDYNNVLAMLPADWPVGLNLRRDGQSLEVTTRLDRLPLRLPLLYVTDLAHNRRELLAVLDHAAERMPSRVAPGASRVIFHVRAWQETGERRNAVPGDEGTRNPPERGIEGPAEQESKGQPALCTLHCELYPASTTQPQPAPLTGSADDAPDPLGAAVRAEWDLLARPLLCRPSADPEGMAGLEGPAPCWELLGGDEVGGRIVSVVEFRPDAERRVRWKFDYQTAALLQVAIGVSRQPEATLWTPAEVRQLGALHWPGRWSRLSREQRGEQVPAGGVLTLEIDAIEVTSASTPGDGRDASGSP